MSKEHRKKEKAYRVSAGKTSSRHLDQPHTDRTIPLKQHLKKADKEGMNWINLAQDRNKQQEALGNTRMDSLTP